MKLYGLIGKPLTHSFSKAYFTEKFRSEGIVDCRYENFELDAISELPTISKAHADLQGLNVTIPYKKEVLSYLHYKNEIVEATGACNCIKITDGVFYGYNTDVPGFQKSLQPHLKPHHTKALVLGTGGSSVAVQYALKQLGIQFRLVSRKKSRQALAYNEIDAGILHEYTVLINTTPVGMFPNTDAAPELPYEILTEKHLLYDLIYNPGKTQFLQRGEGNGATVTNGHKMLLLQAEESWTIWNS
jgi:shikimate dehydrogenase